MKVASPTHCCPDMATSEVTNLHKEFNVSGAYTYMVQWKPLIGC